MRRATLELLRCPRCGAGSLVPEAPVAEPAMIFGPVRCLGCTARFPVHEGLVDLVGDRKLPGRIQQAMELPCVARSWERYVRPAMDAVLTRGLLDRESEYTGVHSMVGRPPGPVVDLGCGAGLFLRRLGRALPDHQLIGLDVSRPMLDEALAQLKEHATPADLIRAEVPPLPFVDRALGGIIASGLVHFLPGLDALLREAARVLKPRGVFVATTYETSAALGRVHGAAGLYPRDEATLRAMCQDAGLVHFERMKVGAALLWKVEQP